MKNSRSTRQQYGNSERKGGKRSEKAAKLDRKSSRGMIYENEELRLRTININAEVERGQSDIKRLRRENEHLRREIWTLRDECDRLNKRFKAKILEHDHSGCNARGSGGSGGACPRGCDGLHSHSNSDDSDSCDTCRGDDEHCSDECCRDGKCNQLPAKQAMDEELSRLGVLQQNSGSSVATSGTAATFDHLSVVSEETLSNSEMLAPHNEHLLGYTPDIMLHGSQSNLPSLVGPLTPLTPIELVANQLNDLQAMVPPLSYFENILAQHMGSTIGTTPESSTTTTSTGGNTVRHTNGWDYNLQSPFAQRKCPTSSSSTATSTSTASRSPVLPQRYAAQPQTLTTFVPTTLTPPTIINTNECGEEITPHLQYNAPQSIETVAITTMPANMPPPTLNSPKHFFAPLKPRLKINTSLANNKQLIPAGPPVIPGTATPSAHQHCEPPDIYVTNGLASPYQRPVMPNSSVASKEPATPALPQRLKSPQVSPSHRRRHRTHHVQHQHQQQHQYQQLQQRPQQQTAAAVTVSVADVAAARAVSPNTGISTMPINTQRPQVPAVITPAAVQLQQLQQPRSPQSPLHITTSNTSSLTKLNEPIYATAQKSCKILISATALTKPLMTATTSTTKSTTASTANLSKTTTVSEATTTSTTTSTATDSFVQTDSANLEAILHDIENISDDILAIQLDKNRSHENIAMTNGKSLQQADKSKKPYRSEMNLLLSYDGTNGTTITPTTTTATTTAALQAAAAQAARTRSLEREHTDSPSPNVPDPMTPFPDNRTYIGFDQLNKAVGSSTTAINVQLQQKPPLPPAQVVATVGGGIGAKPATPPKPTPPTPPARMYPPPLNIRCAGVARATPMSTSQQTTSGVSAAPGSPVHGLTPNKSHLFAAIAQAAAKRAQFRAMPPELSRSLDADIIIGGAGDEGHNLNDGLDEAAQTDAARRKARHVSIACGDANSPSTPEYNSSLQHPLRAQAYSPGGGMNCTPPVNPATASCSDIAAALATHALRNLKQTSHSTPNSPHSMRRRSNSNNMVESPLATAPTSTGDASPHPQPHGATHAHQHSHSNSNSSAVGSNALHRKHSGTSADLAAAAAIVARSKCSRRHSDGTVASNVQRISGASGGGSGGGGAHHHSHHHHQHSASLLSNNPHHSHHSHQDSNQETGTSLSDRNSGSLASSRESSTSFSMRSSRRKISVSSHTGGKIPWCGCWGNGCL